MARRKKTVKTAPRKTGAIRSVVLFYNEAKVDAQKTMRKAKEALRKAGLEVHVADHKGVCKDVKSCDLVVSLGGDGTMLRTARLIAQHSVPMLGVNAGGLGFLSAFELSALRKGLRDVVQGKYSIEERWMLSVEVRRGTKVLFGPHPALNDCVVRAADQARAVKLEAESAGSYVASYFGDGLVVSTPTGSTAYSLAVGGPVVVPDVDAYVLSPVSPHSLTLRPIIMPASAPLNVRLEQRNPYEQPQALVSLDGQMDHPLGLRDRVYVRRYPQPLKLMMPTDRSHFDVLRRKLKWSAR